MVCQRFHFDRKKGSTNLWLHKSIATDSTATHRPDNAFGLIKYFDYHVTDKWLIGSLRVSRAVNKPYFLACRSHIITHH